MSRRTNIALCGLGALAAPALMPAAAVAQYGPDTCRQGYVWREAFQGDHVCVRPWVRAQVAADNATAASRMLGSGQCVYGYVWREAFPGDHVCVTPETRARTAADTDRAPYRRAY